MLADRSHSFGDAGGLSPGGTGLSGLSFGSGGFVGFGTGLSITWMSAVAVLQYRLKELGFNVDYADGRYGGNTEFAVKLFEAYHMLPVDGEADMEMLQRLNQYYEKKAP
jgi:hypothetical protein